MSAPVTSTADRIESVDVAVIGGGISGLVAAYELSKRGCSARVLEGRTQAGGVIQTERVDGFVIDAGPDALLVQKPAAIDLCGELGLGGRLVPTKVPRTAFILRGRRLHPLPGSSVLGFPTRAGPLVGSRLFSLSAKLRMAAEIVIPKRHSTEDESIAAFVRRRFGREAVTYVAEPLLAGIHAGDVDRLSMQALFPRLTAAEAATGSVIRAFRRQRGPVSADGVFRSFPNGLRELVDGLLQALPASSVQLDSRVTHIDAGDGFTVQVEGKAPVRARAVILAVPGFAAARLLRPIDPALATDCEAIDYLSTATVVFAFPAGAVGHDLQGSGFVVPRAEGLTITAGAWISSKWPHRAPEGQVLIRGFLGGARDPEVLSKTDGELIDAALTDLTTILGIRGAPTLTRVYRWPRSSPQLEVGHGDLMTRIEARLEQHRGLFVSASGFRGVGIPDCIADARATAAAAATFSRQATGDSQ